MLHGRMPHVRCIPGGLRQAGTPLPDADEMTHGAAQDLTHRSVASQRPRVGCEDG